MHLLRRHQLLSAYNKTYEKHHTKQKLELQLALIRHYSEDDDARAIVLNLPLSEEEYRYLFNYIDQKTLLAIVEYEASFFEFIAPEKQTLPMAVVAYEDNKKMLQHIRKDLQRKNVISEMTTCHKSGFLSMEYA